MTSATSHGSPGSGTAVPPLRREVLVDAGRDIAFEVFTQRIRAWWPLAHHSVYGVDAEVSFVDPGVGARIVESKQGEDDAIWGTVTQWVPGELIAFSWHPGMPAEAASKVSVSFEETDGKTLVTLEHTGWESFGDRAAEARENYAGGWSVVLDRYLADVSRVSEETDGDTWVALIHRPADPHLAGRVFADPRFGDHLDFIRRMAEVGYLVGAGPLADRPGEGMTILRLPGADRLDEATQLATDDDVSVATGFFTVEVRPWRVVMHA